jgi:hypothetical protein|tara:strand:- start:17 stop:184 length:168 start_codon:yes stop_codon:yes gene_type:complete
MHTAYALQVAIMPWYIDRVGLEGPGFLSLLRIIRAPARLGLRARGRVDGQGQGWG